MAMLMLRRPAWDASVGLLLTVVRPTRGAVVHGHGPQRTATAVRALYSTCILTQPQRTESRSESEPLDASSSAAI